MSLVPADEQLLEGMLEDLVKIQALADAYHSGLHERLKMAMYGARAVHAGSSVWRPLACVHTRPPRYDWTQRLVRGKAEGTH